MPACLPRLNRTAVLESSRARVTRGRHAGRQVARHACGSSCESTPTWARREGGSPGATISTTTPGTEVSHSQTVSRAASQTLVALVLLLSLITHSLFLFLSPSLFPSLPSQQTNFQLRRYPCPCACSTAPPSPCVPSLLRQAFDPRPVWYAPVGALAASKVLRRRIGVTGRGRW